MARIIGARDRFTIRRDFSGLQQSSVIINWSKHVSDFRKETRDNADVVTGLEKKTFEVMVKQSENTASPSLSDY